MTFNELARAIDSDWHYSWYWELSGTQLTSKGIAQAHQDAKKREEQLLDELFRVRQARRHLEQFL